MPDDPAWTCRGGANAGEHCDGTRGSADCGDDGVCGGPMTDGTLCGIETSIARRGDNADPAAVLGALGSLAATGGLPAQLANTPVAAGVHPADRRRVLGDPAARRAVVQLARVQSHRRGHDAQRAHELRLCAGPAAPDGSAQRGSSNEIPIGQAPFTKKTYCKTYEVPQNYSIAIMTGHHPPARRALLGHRPLGHADLRELRLQRSRLRALRSVARVPVGRRRAAHARVLRDVQQRREGRRLSPTTIW